MAKKGNADVRVEQIKFEKARMVQRFGLINKIVDYLGRALDIAAIALPVVATGWLAKPFAGKNTDVHVNIVMSVSLVASLTVSGLLALRHRQNKKALRLLESSNKKLTKELGIANRRLTATDSESTTAGGDTKIDLRDAAAGNVRGGAEDNE